MMMVMFVCVMFVFKKFCGLKEWWSIGSEWFYVSRLMDKLVGCCCLFVFGGLCC